MVGAGAADRGRDRLAPRSAAASWRSGRRTLAPSACLDLALGGRSRGRRSPAGRPSASAPARDGSRTSTARAPWRARHGGPARPAQPATAAEVGDGHRPRGRAGGVTAGRGGRFAAPIDVAPAPSSSGSARSSASRSRPRRPWRGRITFGAPPPNDTTPSRLPRRVATWPMASETPSATSALRLVGGAERHRRGRVEHEPGGQRPLAHVHAHVRLLHARGHVPVNVAHVVARVVRADHRQLGSGAHLRRQVLARHEALDAAQDGEVERAQHGGRHRAGTRALRSALDGRERSRLTAAALRASSPLPCRPRAAAARRRRTPRSPPASLSLVEKRVPRPR